MLKVSVRTTLLSQSLDNFQLFTSYVIRELNSTGALHNDGVIILAYVGLYFSIKIMHTHITIYRSLFKHGQTSKIELIAEIVNDLKSLTIFVKSFI